jgi:ubiquinone/menaquinone biosynthesis C-methylase UbiE
MTTKRDTARQFGRMSRAYADSPGHARGTDLQTVVNFLEPEADMVILDVATGPGHTAMAVAPRARHVVAADLAIEMIGETRRIASARGFGNVSGIVMDVEALAFPDGSFDGITCRIAAHHFHHIDRAVAEMGRVLKRGGRFVVEDSASPADPLLDGFLNSVETLRDPTHVRSYTETEWRALIRGAGLDFQWARLHRKRHTIADWLARAGLDREREERVYASFEDASPEIRDYFEIAYEGSRAVAFTDDKLIFRAEKP